eukprot:gene2632-3034_t
MFQPSDPIPTSITHLKTRDYLFTSHPPSITTIEGVFNLGTVTRPIVYDLLNPTSSITTPPHLRLVSPPNNPLPSNVNRLDICYHTDSIPVDELFPTYLKCLNLRATHSNNHILEIPLSLTLTHLLLGDHNRVRITVGLLPPSITHLTTGSGYIEPGSIPNSVTHLYIGNNNHTAYEPGTIPNSVTYLKISQHIIPIPANVIPTSVTHLVCVSENTRFELNAIPNSVTHLDLPEIRLYSLPTSLRQLRTTFSYGRVKDHVHESRFTITFDNISASNPLPHSFPSNVLGNPLELLQQFPGLSITISPDEFRYSPSIQYRQINDRYALIHGSFTSSIVPLRKLKSAKFLDQLINRDCTRLYNAFEVISYVLALLASNIDF